ncbi:putative damage-inducible protein DinB [Neobacillus niacini]|uniref:DinB family protein n=1 Tax=Neobacillus driksii TaxID=3035913 RepID=UPI002787E090|nr:DinB family protein [Neobacillus niacini]MDQ0971243.1 putative damage-inducible protein DinB [Neobacillus niacini]
METIQSMFKHLHWANQRILQTLQNGQENKKAINLFSHILHAENVWNTRLKGADSSHLPIWEEVSLESCVEMVNQNHHNYDELLSTLFNSNLDQLVSYKNSNGTEFDNSIRDILTHVALHGQYHRGQINQLLRAANKEPISVDYIIFKR